MKDSLIVSYEVPKYDYSLVAKDELLTGFSDKVLANLLAPTKPDFCGQKFEVKINDVIFVGFPTVVNVMKDCLQSHGLQQTDFTFNVVFALREWVSIELIATYQDLSRQLAVALCHEEHRVGYLSNQKQMMLGIQDNSSNVEPDCPLDATIFIKCLESSSLAKTLRRIYDDICLTGTVQVYINSWIAINLCLEPKVSGLVCQRSWGYCPFVLQPQVLQRCIKAIRPYHTLLLTEEENVLLDSLPLDASPTLVKLIRVSSPLKNLQSLASEADLDMRQVVRLAASLVYWGKAMIIFPLCETNNYMVAPHTNTAVNSMFVQRFQEHFPDLSLPMILSEFSMPCALKDHRDVLGVQQNPGQDVQVVIWLMRHRLIYQVHTFIHLFPKDAKIGKSQAQYRLRMLSGARRKLGHEDEDDDNDVEPSKDMEDRFLGSTSRSMNLRLVPASMKQRHHSQPGVELFAKFTAGERQNIFACTAKEEDLLLLERLSKYLNGYFHLEAIMFYENIRRSQLVALIDKFRDILLIKQHDEADIAFWIYL